MSENSFVIDKRFNSKVKRTPRVLEVAEAFGIGLTDSQFVVYDDCHITVNQGDIMYITGQSGSGKSLLLAELAKELAKVDKKVCNIDDIEFEHEPLVDQVGKTMADATRILSTVGINDAYLLIRTPDQLSDGQKYRLKLAKMIESNADVWVADEFGAKLDRVTAKVVAFNLHKIARKHNATVIVATTHDDLRDELAPDVFVRKTFRERVEIDVRPKK